jgi:nicotinate-nucleotide adenylyltransferase
MTVAANAVMAQSPLPSPAPSPTLPSLACAGGLERAAGQGGEGRGNASSANLSPSPRYRIPLHDPGQRIGLFGGTFDPPHQAHLAACLLAMKRLALDRVWWLVTPGNPLKDTMGLAPLDERIAAARALAGHPRMDVTGIEAEIGVRYTYDTIRYLVSRCPGVRFVWIMGADNLRSFHHWQRWRGIAELVPIAVVDRLGPSLYATGSVAAQALSRRRIPESEARSLLDRPAPAWVLLHGLKSPLSSTALRALRRSQKRCRPQAKIEST